MYYYNLYGCCVASSLEFPQLCVSQIENDDDIVIMEGGVTDEIMEKAEHKYYEIGRDISWFQNDTGVFSIDDGKEIRYQLKEGADIQYTRSYILGYGISMLMLQRGAMTIHSSVVADAFGAILIAGESGSGKSTLTTNYLKAGYRFVADDIVVVRVDERNRVMAYPAFPYQKLCRDMVNREKFNLDDLIYIDEQKDKFLVSRKEIFEPEPVPVKSMIMLSSFEGVEVEIEEIVGINKLSAIGGNLFLRRLHGEWRTDPSVVQRLLDIGSKIPIYRVKRPQNINTIGTLKETIDKRLA